MHGSATGLLAHIALALDFSEASVEAAKAIFHIAHLGHTKRLTILHVAMGASAGGEGRAGRSAAHSAIEQRARFSDLETRVQQSAEAQLHKLLSRIPVPPSVSVDYVIRGGKPAVIVPRVLAAARATMLAVGHESRNPASRFWAGGVAELVVHETKVPTLILPTGHDGVTPGGELSAFKRALIAVDLDENHDEVVRQGVRLVEALAGERPPEIVLTAVADPVDDEAVEILADDDDSFVGHIEDYRDHLESEAGACLDKLAARCRSAGVVVKTLVRRGRPGPSILSTAADVGAQLVVVGTKGHFLDLGATARHVVRHADVSVLAVPSGPT
ncbi:MAG: universal stress protein [Deltaproteobacteria bacterium]|nr:universal stress protein [Deltaproteobacteria bacterium]